MVATDMNQTVVRVSPRAYASWEGRVRRSSGIDFLFFEAVRSCFPLGCMRLERSCFEELRRFFSVSSSGAKKAGVPLNATFRFNRATMPKSVTAILTLSNQPRHRVHGLTGYDKLVVGRVARACNTFCGLYELGFVVQNVCS